MYFVYIIRTLDNSLYIGVTEDLERRVESHDKRKAAKWTTVHRGAHCVFTEAYSTLGAARKREIQLKKWSRAKKEALIAGDIPALKTLSRSKSKRSRKNTFQARKLYLNGTRSHAHYCSDL